MNYFWEICGEDYVIPSESPEGFDVVEWIKGEANGYNSVVDLGCGYGRLCKSFDPSKYLGIDVNDKLLQRAREEYPNYRFGKMPVGGLSTDLCFVYTLFLHLEDDEILDLLSLVNCKYLQIVEILGREWRRDGYPLVFNRDLEDYKQLLKDFQLVKERKKVYQRYSSEKRDVYISMLLFRNRLK